MSEISHVEYGEIVRDVMEEAKLKLQDIADHLEVSKGVLCQRMAGKLRIRDEEMRAILHLHDRLVVTDF